MTRSRLGNVVLSACAIALVLIPGNAAALADRGPQAPATAAPVITVPPPDTTQELVLRDGTRAYGRVESVDGSRIVFRTSAGAPLTVEAAQIRDLRTVEGRFLKGEFLPADPNPTRLFFAPTARSLPPGTAYVGIYEFVMPFVQVGITDRFSFGGGTPLVFGGGSSHPFWVTPKFQVLAAKSTQAAVGVMHFLNVGDGQFGIAYGVVTQGNRDSAVTVGAGYAYVNDSDDIEGAGMIMFGGEHRVSRRVKLITENYAFDGGGMASIGVRFMGERLSADLGMMVPLGIGEVVAFPMVNFVWQFGRR